MPGPTHMLYPIRHSVASNMLPARSVARPAAAPSGSRATSSLVILLAVTALLVLAV